MFLAPELAHHQGLRELVEVLHPAVSEKAAAVHLAFLAGVSRPGQANPARAAYCYQDLERNWTCPFHRPFELFVLMIFKVDVAAAFSLGTVAHC